MIFTGSLTCHTVVLEVTTDLVRVILEECIFVAIIAQTFIAVQGRRRALLSAKEASEQSGGTDSSSGVRFK